MKKNVNNIIKFIIFFGLGVFLVWWFVRDLSETDKLKIWQSFKDANYFWIFLSFVMGAFPFLSRAYRWVIMLEALGYKPKPANSFFALSIGYLVNLAIPRLGEITRCGVMNRYEKVPFPALLGTLFIERLMDVMTLFILTGIVLGTQYDLLKEFANEIFFTPLYTKLIILKGNAVAILIISAVFVIITGVGIYILKSKFRLLYDKIKGIVESFIEGVIMIKKIKNKTAFILHSLFIWIGYVIMFYLCFFAYPETASLPFIAVLTAFVFCTFGIIAIPGGIGIYPIIMAKSLALYGAPETIGFAFGWVEWASQTLVLLIVGVVSLVMVQSFNQKIQIEASETGTN